MYRIPTIYLLLFLFLANCTKEDLPTPSSPPIVINDNNSENESNDNNNDPDNDSGNESNNDELNNAIPEVSIEVLSEVYRVFLDRQALVMRLRVTDGDLAPRIAVVRVSQSEIDTRGALILSSQGFGNNFYGRTEEKQNTIIFAKSKGFQVFEIRWDGAYGWGTDVEGVGYTKAVRAYTGVVDWLKDNRVTEPSLMVAHGGSGGSFQIGYGLVRYNLEEILDYAILAAGPPTSDLNRGIYGTPNDVALWPNDIGLDKTDYIQGWQGNGDYCANRRTINPPVFVLTALAKESLVSDIKGRDYDYAGTKLYFINTNDLTNADEQGRLYFDKITSAKEWIFLPNETAHDVGGIATGAQRIRQALNEILQ